MIGTWIGVVIGVIGLAFAFYEHRQHARVEAVVRDTLRRLAGDVSVMFSNARWSEIHMVAIIRLCADPIPDLMAIKKHAADGVRDATTCSRQVSGVHSQIRGIQKSYFHDDQDTLPEILAEDVKEAYRRAEEQ